MLTCARTQAAAHTRAANEPGRKRAAGCQRPPRQQAALCRPSYERSPSLALCRPLSQLSRGDGGSNIRRYAFPCADARRCLQCELNGRQPRKRAALGVAKLHMLTRMPRQAHSFWGHSAALDLQELASAARRARAAADAAECSGAQPGAASDVAPPEEFTCLQARAARRVCTRVSGVTHSRLRLHCARSPPATAATPRCCSAEWAAERRAACAHTCTRCA